MLMGCVDGESLVKFLHRIDDDTVKIEVFAKSHVL